MSTPTARKNLQQIFQKIADLRRTEHPWVRGEPFRQCCFTFDDGEWKEYDPLKTTVPNVQPPSEVTIVSWNIDFMRVLTRERMAAALKYLQQLVEGSSNQPVIMLNEMLESDLEQIQAEDWVRRGYYMTDITRQYWESGYYGTCVLVPKSLPIKDVFRVHYVETAMERDGLFVDIEIGHGHSFRICCTHLESLIANPPKRPHQVAAAAKFMHQAYASALAGDLNAIEPFDKRLHADNGLKDAYLETGGQEDAASGMTWGQMAPTQARNQFGLSRMDKLFFCGGTTVKSFETFGMDAVVDDVEQQKHIVEIEGVEKGWVTDHLGVKATFEIVQPPSRSTTGAGFTPLKSTI